MSDPQTKADIIEHLRAVQHDLSATVQRIPAADFDRGTAEAWSPANYLKHLLLSVKPFAKAITFPPDALKRRFGTASYPSQTYAELVARYQARLDEGIRAEDYDMVMPTTFRIPDDTPDLQVYLLDLWNEAHDRMIDGLGRWSEVRPRHHRHFASRARHNHHARDVFLHHLPQYASRERHSRRQRSTRRNLNQIAPLPTRNKCYHGKILTNPH